MTGLSDTAIAELRVRAYMYGRAIQDAIAGAFIVVAVVAFLLGGLVFWGLPRLWALIKPLIHALTA